MSNNNAQKVLQKDSEGKVIKLWQSAYQASEALNCSCQQIKRFCEGSRKKPVAGFNWAYVSEEEVTNSNLGVDNNSSFVTPAQISKFGKYLTATDEVATVLQGPNGMFFVLNESDMTVSPVESLGTDTLLKKI